MPTTFTTASQYDNSLIVQTRWDYATSLATNKWSSEYQAYRLQTPYKQVDGQGNFVSYLRSVVTAKSKIRGRGDAMTIRFTTEPGKECRLLGWASPFTATTDV